MKKILLGLFITLITVPAMAQIPIGAPARVTEEIREHNEKNHNTTEKETTIERDIIVDVDGMVCDFCAQSIKKVFGKQDSIIATDVDLDAGQIIVDVKDGAELSDEKIEEMITFSGYEVTKITR